MADSNTSLPIRTQAAGDAIVKICDATTTTDQLKVESNGSINVNAQGGSFVVTATNLDIRDLVFATDKADVSGSTNLGLDAATLAALESITVQNGAGAAAVNIQDGGNVISVDSVDLDIRDLDASQDNVEAWLKDEAGNAFTTSNPLPVSISAASPGDEINDYKTAAAVAAAASDNHDYTVTALKTLLLSQVVASASGKAKIEIQIETGVATGIYTSRAVFFNSTANPNMEWKLAAPIAVAAGVRVRVIVTNRDNQAMDLYSTISGIEE